VRVNGTLVRDLSTRVSPERDLIEVDGTSIAHVEHVYVMLNKPRGLVTTAKDPQGRATIYDCLRGASLPFVAPVGRLDRASEGLLLLTNDSRWSSRLLDPASHVDKVYHVQVAARTWRRLSSASPAASRNDGERLDVSDLCCARARARVSEVCG
jgi:23S rRNA pseudouridine2605 synthase